MVTSHARQPVTDVYGLVLAGGTSRRMQHDKALIDYHGEPQLLWTYRLLASLLPRVFVSVRPSQQDEPVRSELPQIVDIREDAGPAAGILAAQTLHPDVAWLVVACDLPRLDEATLRHLLEARDPAREATAFISRHDGLPEPLCALWEPASHARLLQRVDAGKPCPRKALIQGDTQLLQPLAAFALDNINTPEELASLRNYPS
jgi:molybdopterin-guanine dinucleotide biosynthesis protein A